MKLLRYGEKGRERPGLLDQDGCIRDLSEHIDDLSGNALETGTLMRLAAIDPRSLPMIEGEVRLGPCVGRVGKFIAISLNFGDHAAEVEQEVPQEPVVLLKATSSISGPNDDVVIPRGSTKVDWEVELGVVIGKGGVYIDEADALDHVAGYCIVNDVSARDFQMERGGTWDKGKGCDTFGPLGPWLVTKDEAGDVSNLDMWLEVDGKRYQDGSTRTMIFGIAEIVSYVSGFMSLQSGDVITTGTPPGNGMAQIPPVFLKPGNVMHLHIDKLGEQRQRVVSS
ncbi:fumarylacetoacetate hydrolase family protein [Aminobacter anthyllidis]|uniref:Fumarylacetoacetate hydrolase family protein n=1 Tax=Aminobacter anthyllidis TaxID=1035067 RepID=A0A9X1ACS0_9HYPH|nr:fumarylacetoacetate hydrolase family protein [Aminobacter anthyllidis]MBT1157241.1 fumarylacetoacetate hydrolase family protein [Aminobacter anthyllidis]